MLSCVKASEPPIGAVCLQPGNMNMAEPHRSPDSGWKSSADTNTLRPAAAASNSVSRKHVSASTAHAHLTSSNLYCHATLANTWRQARDEAGQQGSCVGCVASGPAHDEAQWLLVGVYICTR